MSELPRPGEDFEPTKDVKNLWTYTRKSSFNAAGIRLPGLFTTKNFDVDAAAFVAVLFLEAWGLFSLVSSFGLRNEEGGLNIFGIGGAFALFLIDLALAFLRHLPTGPECRYKNEWVLALTAQEQQKLLNQRSGRRWLAPICAFLILLVAGVKVYLFYMLNEGEITGLTASVLVSYVFAALLHINNTGYFLAGLYFNRKIRKDYNKWANGAFDAHSYTIYGKRPYAIEVSRDESISIKEANAGEHKIRQYIAESGEPIYFLETWGVLTDRELAALIVLQSSPNAKTSVARTGLMAQLDILNSDPLPQSIQEDSKPTEKAPYARSASANVGSNTTTRGKEEGRGTTAD
jgi:hypothetical protein